MASDQTVVSDNVFEDFYYTPIKTAEAGELNISNNIIRNPAFDIGVGSITVSGPFIGTTARGNFIISGNIIDNQYGAGIGISGPAAHPSYNTLIENNIIYSCDTYGIHASYMTAPLSICGNVINCSNITNAIEVNNTTGVVQISKNSLYNLTTGDVGVFCRTAVTAADFIISGNSMSSDGTAAYFISVVDASSAVMNGNSFVGDDISIHVDDTANAVIIGNHGANVPVIGAGVTTVRVSDNSWEVNKYTDIDVYRAATVSLLDDAVRVHRPGAFGNYAFVSYADGSQDAIFGSTYAGGDNYGRIILRQYNLYGVPVYRDAVTIDPTTGDVTCSGDIVATAFKVGANQVVGAQAAAQADLKANYTTLDLDTEAEIIAAINATNAGFNTLLAKLRTHGIIDT